VISSFVPSGRTPIITRAEPVVFETDVEVHAIDPDVHVIAVGQAPLLERAVLALPLVGQPRDVRGGQPGRIVAEQNRQRLAEVAGGEASQVEDGQDLGDLRGPAHVGRQDAAREAAPFAVGIGASVVYPGRAHGDGPSPDGDPPGAPLAVADDQGVSNVVAFLAVRLQVRSDLDLQSCHEHAARSLAGDLVDQRSPVYPVLRRLVADDIQHGCASFPPRAPGRRSIRPDASGITGSTIHNFRSYLDRQRCRRELR
jgi:hypothetical protein